MSLSVVYMAETGHVVGALAMTGATAPTEVESFVGNRLPLRIALGPGNLAELPLRDRELAVAVVDDEAAVFVEPLVFGVEMTGDIPPQPKPALLRLGPLSGYQVSVTAAKVTVTLDIPVVRLTRVFVMISDGQDTTRHDTDIVAGQTTAEFSVSLKAQDRVGLLALVTGYAGRFEAVTVS
jgi:hypothetical protein